METTSSEITHTDPVCGMTVTAGSAAGKHEHKGTTHYFCSPGCLHQFKKDPEKYLDSNYKPSM